MRKSVQRAAVMLGVVAAAATAFAAPAQADGRGDCPDEHVCLWWDRNFTGLRWQGKYDNSSIGTANDKASSAFNNGRTCWVYLWTDPGYAGTNLPMALGAYRAYMNTDPGPSPVGSWEDIVSSVHWCSPR
ncbi:peptidase inhibitor family I36 protein [Micromonospora sp. NBC_01392]|uniref:peptidase inhibitor family I36 protein n=1 Tax=Micromonospora sp. NBC_01392 TaxID=2903588 RepID=UPI00324D3910